jgi:biopolymer transport protein ExbB
MHAEYQTTGNRRFPWLRIVLYCLFLVAYGGWLNSHLSAPRVAAQESSVDESAAPAPRDPPAASTSTTARASSKVPSSLLDMFIASGVIGYLIALLSVVALGFIIEHAMTIRKNRLMPDQAVVDLEGLIRHGNLDQAIEYCQQPDNQSLFSSVVLAGLERFRSSEFGFAEYKAAVEEAGEEETSALYRKTEGMILGFNVIATTEGTARPEDLASSISLALVTTFEGLVVAIPTMVAFSFFRNRIDTLVAETGKRVEQVLGPLGRRRA